MSMALQRLLLFGDQTVEKLPSIQKLVRVSRTSPSLRRFLREATDVIQTEVTKLSPDERKAFFSFDNLLTLAEENAKQEAPNEIVATTLMCIARLGELILYVENDPSILGSSDSTVHILDLCTGLIPVAAAAVAKDLNELLKFGLEMIAVAVRLAQEITLRSMRIEETPASWAYTIVGATVEESQAVLERFHQTQNLPVHRHAYVGVTSRTWTTIFGPPSVLAKLWSFSPELGLAPKLRLAVGAAVHAAHLPLLDMTRIMGSSILLDAPILSNAQIISSSTGMPFVAPDLHTLLYKMILDITQNTLRLTDTVQAVVSDLRGKGDVNLIVVGPTSHTSSLQNALQDADIKVLLTDHAESLPPPSKLRGGSDLVAIVGMSGRFPGSENIQEFWETLQKGQDLHKKIPPSRFDLDAHFDPSGEIKNTMMTQYGCFLEHPGLFDSRLFNVSPRESAQMDPLQRLLLMTSYEALEMAGYTQDGSLSTESKRIATYMGQATDDWRSVGECQGIDIYYVPGVARAFTPGRLNYHFKWGGASHSLDAACAGSSTAVDLACSALIARECDTALAGGGSILTAPAVYAGLSRGGFLSRTGACKSLRDDADGYCRGEGVGVVVMKRLEDAIADNDNIQAVISSSARIYSAEALSITQPHAETQAKLYKKVLQKACVDPNNIGYIEMHGTGTQWGDVTEIQSITSVFGESRTKDNPLVVGAVKANVGHGEAAAGITSLIKTVMTLRESSIPPQPGMPFRVNRKFPPLEKMNVKIASENSSFKAPPKGDGKRRLLLNNFDASGGATCLIVEDPPKKARKAQDPRTCHVVTVSARTAYSLRENKQRLVQFLSSHPNVKLSDLAYTTTARRLHHAMRSAYSAQTIRDLTQLISADFAEAVEVKSKRAGAQSSVVFAFTGQGSLYPGMGRQLFQTCSRFRESILSYQKICDSQGLPSVVDLIADDHADLKSKTIVQIQLATVFLEIALADLWKSWGVKPTLLIGHSLGEYAALCVAGVISISDTLHLVGRRSLIMLERCSPGSHAMLAVESSWQTTENVLATGDFPSCQISCMNAPNTTIVSGTIHELKTLQSSSQASRTRSTFLQVSYGFHSPQVDPILADFEHSATGVHFAKPLVPIASTLTGMIVDDVGTFTPSYLVRHAREPVNFIGALQTCRLKGFADEDTLWMEMGPESVCLGLIRSSLEVPSTRLLPSLKSSKGNWETISSSIAAAYTWNVAVSWTEYHREYTNSLTLLEIPTYAFDLKDYWSSYKQELLLPQTSQAASVSATTPSRISLNTTCLQYVEKESFKGNDMSVTFSSHTSEPKLFDAIQSHLVDDTALCPASVFCEMAFTAAKYIYTKAKPGKSVPAMSLWALEITHPLVVPVSNPEQVVEVTAKKSGATDWSVNVSFTSRDGSSFDEHGGCQVRFDQMNDLMNQFLRTLHLVKKRKDVLISSAAAGLSHRLLKPIVYKLFSTVVDYGHQYQGLEEVFLDSGYTDAAARVKLGPSTGTGNFTYNPYWTDAIVHLAGFILNGNVTKPNDVAYISAGFETFQVFKELSEDKSYTSYVCMQAMEKKGVFLGDVYLFEDEQLVCLCAGVFFQEMTKRVRNTIFGKSSRGPVQGITSRSQVALTKRTSGEHINEMHKTEQTSSSEISRTSESTPGLSISSSQTSLDGQEELDVVDNLLAIVALECGVDIKDMEPSTMFSDMGVDSLMSIAIISAVKERMDLDLPATFFNDHLTVAAVRGEFGKQQQANEASVPTVKIPEVKVIDGASIQSEELSPTSTTSDSENSEGNGMIPPTPPADPIPAIVPQPSIESSKKTAPQPASKAVLIRGRASSKETPLFLTTDGAGSVTAYIHLPPISTGNRIYALESPFLHCPENYNCSVEEMCSIFCAAIRKTQPQGPYIVGGWSAGAIYAYEVARQLLEQNERILGLVLIDMRVPRPMPDALEPTIDLINSAGLFTGINRSGQSKTPASHNLKQHLVSTVKALTYYKPIPMDVARRPSHNFIIWAKKGLSESEQDDFIGLKDEKLPRPLDATSGNVMEDPETGMKSWFYAKRTAFGPNGWDQFLGDVECHVIEKADHFSMVTPPLVKELGIILDMAMKKSMAAGAST